MWNIRYCQIHQRSKKGMEPYREEGDTLNKNSKKLQTDKQMVP